METRYTAILHHRWRRTLNNDRRRRRTHTRRALWTLIGIGVYSIISFTLNNRPHQIIYLPSPIRSPLSFRPDVAIPMFLGFVFGPILGFLSGLIGTMISDYFSYHQLFLNWDIAIGLMGLILSVGY
jgi:energy-coupling factor transport system substrate-specific component